MRRTVPPSAEIQAEIDKLLSRGMVDEPQKMLGELGRLGARLIIQRAVDRGWVGLATSAVRAAARPAQLRLGVA